MNDRRGWRRCRAGVLGCLLVALTPGEAAAEPPLCRGKDFVAELAKTNGAVARPSRQRATPSPIPGRTSGASSATGQCSRIFSAPCTRPIRASRPCRRPGQDGRRRSRWRQRPGDVGAMQSRRDLVAMPPGEGLSRHLGAREVERLDQAAREWGASAAALDQVHPWLIALMLADPPCERARLDFGLEVLDARIEAAGRKQGADVGRLAAMPLELQLLQFKAMLTMGAEAEDYEETFVRLYLGRRLGDIWPPGCRPSNSGSSWSPTRRRGSAGARTDRLTLEEARERSLAPEPVPNSHGVREVSEQASGHGHVLGTKTKG